MVHLSAVKQEFQLEIQPLPITSKTVRAGFLPLVDFDLVVLIVIFSQRTRPVGPAAFAPSSTQGLLYSFTVTCQS
jgi:hypothetical protein